MARTAAAYERLPQRLAELKLRSAKSIRALTRVAISIVVAACGSSSSDGPNGPPALTNSIVFVSDRGGSPQLYIMSADGSHVRQLTDVAGNKGSPVFSPDGRRVAFAMHDTASVGPQQIYLINSDGSGLVPLAPAAGLDEYPTWSTDGARLAFSSDRAHNGWIGLWVINADGTGLQPIDTTVIRNLGPSWSPRTNTILFMRGELDQTQISRIDPDGSSRTYVTKGGLPEWSPSGTRFLYSCVIANICIAQDSTATVVDTLPILSYYNDRFSMPQWSPDEQRLVYATASYSQSPLQIWTASAADGASPIQLTSSSSSGSWGPSWTRH
jgi:Tol biopolymer transport system component